MPKPKWLPGLERAAHIAMGAGARLVYLDLLLWRREAVKQWPPATDREPVAYLDLQIEDAYIRHTFAYWDKLNGLTEYFSAARTEDTMSDLYDMILGATLVEFVRWPLVVYAIWRICG